MKPYYDHKGITIYHADCRDVLPELHEIDTVITDSPYGINFMGKDWDRGIPGPHFWELIRAACKPGAMMLCFGGTRTFHRLGCFIEDAGWQMRDCIMWVYGQGFPKSLDISKAIDKAAGAEREVVGDKLDRPGEVVGRYQSPENTSGESDGGGSQFGIGGLNDITAPATDAAKLWSGYGTGLKPAWEPIFVCMNPLDGTFAENALKHGVAGLNIDGGRVEHITVGTGNLALNPHLRTTIKNAPTLNPSNIDTKSGDYPPHKAGRFPANLIHDGSDEVLEVFARAGERKSGARDNTDNAKYETPSGWRGTNRGGITPASTGTAARFFYCAKASRAERERGLRGYIACHRCGEIDTHYHISYKSEVISYYKAGRGDVPSIEEIKAARKAYKASRGRGPKPKWSLVNCMRNTHPTVKSLALLRYLCRLTATPTGGVILDSFVGSGSTLAAAKQEGRHAIGIETEEQNCEIAARRCEATQRQKIVKQEVIDFDAARA